MRINPPTLFWILIAAILAAYLFLPLERFDRAWLPWAGGALTVLGIAISVAGKMRFQRAGTNVYTFQEPDKLVTDGLYAVSRNPMYLGLVLAGFGAALASATAAALILAAVFALIVRYWDIAYEEEVMQRRFGAEYDAYCARVRRWSGRRGHLQPAPRPARPTEESQS
ncbi:MAG: isoprenylcysteine carboxylmethyltransferase family protein [Alphaproteobacteria bacterium]|nr:isoprenylcysteine carboxylmethyltransferase family protein [Alphaproteobacteria bacterium]